MKTTTTTGLGIATIISVLSNLALQFFGGGEISGPEIGAAISSIMTAIGLIFAKDQAEPVTLVQQTDTRTIETR